MSYSTLVLVGDLTRPGSSRCHYHPKRPAVRVICEMIHLCEACCHDTAKMLTEPVKFEPVEAVEFPHGEFPNIYSYRESAYPEDE